MTTKCDGGGHFFSFVCVVFGKKPSTSNHEETIASNRQRNSGSMATSVHGGKLLFRDLKRVFFLLFL
jgi:hypothetical protein